MDIAGGGSQSTHLRRYLVVISKALIAAVYLVPRGRRRRPSNLCRTFEPPRALSYFLAHPLGSLSGCIKHPFQSCCAPKGALVRYRYWK